MRARRRCGRLDDHRVEMTGRYRRPRPKRESAADTDGQSIEEIAAGDFPVHPELAKLGSPCHRNRSPFGRCFYCKDVGLSKKEAASGIREPPTAERRRRARAAHAVAAKPLN